MGCRAYIGTLKDQAPEKFLAHPSKILEIQKKLAPRFPYQSLNLRPDENAEMMIEELTDEQSLLLNNLTEAIEKFPGCHKFLSKNFMSLNSSIHFQETALFYRIIKKVPALQVIFKNILARTNFAMEEFPDIIFGLKTAPHPHVFQHLLVLKLLALSEDKDAQNRMLEFINMYEQINVDGIRETTNGVEPFLLSSFTDDPALLETGLQDLEDCLTSRQKENIKILLNLNLSQMELIGKYIFSALPQLDKEREIYFFTHIRNAYSLQNKKVPSLPPLNEKELNNLKIPKDFLNQSYKFYLAEQYEEAEKILNTALIKFAESPSRFMLLREKVDNSLHLKKWEEAENCINILLKEFGNKDILAFNEKGDETIDLSNIQVLKAALCIWQQNFNEAYELLKLALTNISIGEGEWREIDGVETLFPALNAHFDKIPDEIFKIIQENKYIQEDVLTDDDMYSLKYPKVYERLQKGYFKKKKMKKKHKEIIKIIENNKKYDDKGKQDKEDK